MLDVDCTQQASRALGATAAIILKIKRCPPDGHSFPGQPNIEPKVFPYALDSNRPHTSLTAPDPGNTTPAPIAT